MDYPQLVEQQERILVKLKKGKIYAKELVAAKIKRNNSKKVITGRGRKKISDAKISDYVLKGQFTKAKMINAKKHTRKAK